LKSQADFKRLFNHQIHLTFIDLLSLLRQNKTSFRPLFRIIRHQGTAARRRAHNFRLGIPVPPLLIVSTTEACNLKCTGCYAQKLVRPPADLLPDERVGQLLNEASDLGVSIIMLAGGEPLLQAVWLEALAGHPELAGLVFTNGTLLHDQWSGWFSRNRHVLPVISLEGGVRTTDQRRGPGIYQLIYQNMTLLADSGIPFGLSITLTRQNLDEIRSPELINQYIGLGCKLFVFVEYVPVEAGTDEMALTQDERLAFIQWTLAAQKDHPAHFLVFPGDEEPYGGCLAAARGFAHITSSGDLEPCPFAPFSDRNVKVLSLADALRSDLLQMIRERHDLLQEGRGGCALWHNRDWVASWLAEKDKTANQVRPPANEKGPRAGCAKSKTKPH
jgi:MoaA/NifB/PqqE/SkfB family radical SAM enzyme